MQANDLQAATEPTTDADAVENHEKPALIASRRRCEADGVGLSHYILMDPKKAAE